MFNMWYTLAFAIVIAFPSCTVQSNCNWVTYTNGHISQAKAIGYYDSNYYGCWKIIVPMNHLIQLRVDYLDFHKMDCSVAYLKIKVNKTQEDFILCDDYSKKNPVYATSDVQVEYFVDVSKFSIGTEIKFKLLYNIETSIIAIKGVSEARSKAIAWLRSKRTSSWGWQENTFKAVTALFLANGANFNGSNLEEELIAKQTELKTSMILQKKLISTEQLGMLINALLVTCHSPSRFYGQNLVKRLKDQVESSGNFTHPTAYLALCNANESWPIRAHRDLSEVLNSDSEYPFIEDIQAFGVMAISCYKNRLKVLNKTDSSSLMSDYQRILKQFRGHQISYGISGNVHTTSLITQALISSDLDQVDDKNLTTILQYLMNELNTTHVDFASAYLILPILNGKSLSDIANVDCSANPRKDGDDEHLIEIDNYIGPKMRIQYSLIVGEEKDLAYTIVLRVPENFTAYEVMQLATTTDHRYRFKWNRIAGKVYVYKIGDITNDPEAGKYWLLYWSKGTNIPMHSTTSPDEFILSNGDHLLMWYRKAHI